MGNFSNENLRSNESGTDNSARYRAVYKFENITGSSRIIKVAVSLAQKSALSGSNILLSGESGTGKELFAQSIHNESPYSEGPFVGINCAALPRELVESELFGYEGGAFSGAKKAGQPGKFELADGGTIFLDEIGGIPPDVQASLLRVIQTKEVTRIGGTYSKTVNVRIITATNTNLNEAVKNKTFREDLFYRLDVIKIVIPPLRYRGSDIWELSNFFLDKLSASTGKNFKFDQNVYDELLSYNWPGNVRELENVIERAVNISSENTIRSEDLRLGISSNTANFRNTMLDGQGVCFPLTGTLDLDHNISGMIRMSLERTNGNIKKAAVLLGIDRRKLYRYMQKYDIDYTKYRNSDF